MHFRVNSDRPILSPRSQKLMKKIKNQKSFYLYLCRSFCDFQNSKGTAIYTPSFILYSKNFLRNIIFFCFIPIFSLAGTFIQNITLIFFVHWLPEGKMLLLRTDGHKHALTYVSTFPIQQQQLGLLKTHFYLSIFIEWKSTNFYTVTQNINVL